MDLAIGIPLLLLLVTILYYFLIGRRRPKNYPPGPTPLPIIGNLHQVGLRPYETFLAMKKTYGKIIAIDFGSYPAIVINDPKLIREAFAMPELNGRPEFIMTKGRGEGDKIRGLAFNDGKEFSEQRKFAMKTLREFGFGKQSLEALIIESVKELMQRLSEENGNGQPLLPHRAFNSAIINALWPIMTSERFAHDDAKLWKIIKLITEAIENLPLRGAFVFFPFLCKLAPGLTGYNMFVKTWNTMLEMAKEKLDDHRATFQPGQIRDYLDAHIQEIVNCKDKDSSFYGIEGERHLLITLVDIFAGGTETSSSTLSWGVLYLARNPDMQDKFYNEIQSVVGQSRLPAIADRPSMPYTEAIIMEILRIITLFPLAVFHRATETVKFQGFTIPKGTLISPNLHGVHHDPEIWDDPNEFHPERFINEDGTLNRHHEAFLPFNTGRRVCLGESLARDSLFLFLTSLFQKYSVEFNPAKPKPDPNDYSFGVVILPKPFEVILHERN